MFNKKSEKDAARWGILDRIQALEDDLMKITGIVHVDFDIRDYGETWQVILIPEYKIDCDPGLYFKTKFAQLDTFLDVCTKHGLKPSGDVLEDMGQHWYIVRSCDKTWPRPSEVQIER